MKYIFFFAFVLCIFSLNVCIAFSQDSTGATTYISGIRYGVFGLFSKYTYTADFQSLPGVPSCCPRFQTGEGNGVAFGGTFELPYDESIGFSAAVGFSPVKGTLTRDENTTVIIDGGARLGIFRHSITISSTIISLQPAVQLSPFDNFWLRGGLSVGLALNTTYSQEERIIQPSSTGTFADSAGNDTHTRIRNQFTGEINGAKNVIIAPFIGVFYDLPLNTKNTFFLTPQIQYEFPTNNLISGIELSVSAIRAGLGIKYAPNSKEIQEIYREERHIDTVKVPIAEGETRVNTYKRGKSKTTKKKEEFETNVIFSEIIARTDTVYYVEKRRQPVLKTEITDVAFVAKDTGIPQKEMMIEEFQSRIMTPLLTYIFFDENSAEIPVRYQKIPVEKTAVFDPLRANSTDKFKVYYDVLNILGYRMKVMSASTLILTGCNQDDGGEKNNMELSRQRAQSVAQYLTEVWGISPARLTIKSRNLPAQSTPSATPEAAAENRRVEITAEPFDILSPVITSDTLRRTTAENVQFRTETQAEAGAAQYRLLLENSGNTVAEFSGTGAAPTVISWKPESEAIRADAPVSYSLTVHDSAGNSADAHGTVPMNYVSLEEKRVAHKGDKQIDLYSLILFDIRSSDLSAANRKVASYISARLSPKSVITIRGYTDKLGEAGFNRDLALKRAQNTAAALGITGRANIEGIPQAELYDNSLPEGRFYTRTVDIIVETPTE